MPQDRTRQQRVTTEPASNPLEPAAAYEATMELIRHRFVALGQPAESETPLTRAERIALHVRKIVEGVSFGALSGVEHRNRQTLSDLRTRDADKLLNWLESKKLLKLPCAQRVEPPPSPEYRAVFAGAGTEDLDSTYLKRAYSRASSLIHERHPERLSAETVASELAAIEQDAAKLRSWLWLHIMFLRGEGFLIQMGQFGTASFMVSLSRTGDLPA